MSWIYLVAAWLLVGVYTLFGFMVAVFVGGGYANGGTASRSRTFLSLVNSMMFLLPAVGILAGILVTVGYVNEWEVVYRWLFLPPVVIVGYMVLIQPISKLFDRK